MKKLLILTSFLAVTPFLLIFNILYLLSLSQATPAHSFASLQLPQNIAYAALPTNQNVFSGVIHVDDARVGKVLAFLAAYNSPLSDYATAIVMDADKYDIDYRLLPAIAAQESGDCTKGHSVEWKNCWGFGIYTKHITTFASYEEAIDTVSRYFANKKLRGVDTLTEIGAIYNPNDTNGWKAKVNIFMSEM